MAKKPRAKKPAVKKPAVKKARRKREPPFGQVVRKQALAEYFSAAGSVTAATAWEHVYRLLLSVDRRTQLAHVMDSNHMQPGGSFHARAMRFTELLCEHWGIRQDDLPDQIDRMFRACVNEYLAQQTEATASVIRKTVEDIVDAHGGSEEVEDAVSEFLLDVTELLVTRLGLQRSPELTEVVAEIERRAEHYFTIEKKRQNVRGEGFEDTLEWLLLTVASVPRQQVLVRTAANRLPGFKKPIPSKGEKDKVPKPDLAIISPSSTITLAIITVKWSLRQDRLDTFGQESAYYRDHKVQDTKLDFVLLTNEMDIARLRDVLSPPPGGGGFHFDRVYHVNRDLLERTHGDKFRSLEMYAHEGRLLSLSDLLNDAPVIAGS